MNERKVLGEIIQKTIEALSRCNVHFLRVLSREALEYGAINHSKDFVRLATVIHALSKICEKEYYRKIRHLWRGFIERAKALARKSPAEFITGMEEEINVLDSSLGRYAQGILERSRIRIATTLYAWGMSLGVASELSGAPEAEILRQAGATKIADEDGAVGEIRKRIKAAEELI